MSTLTLDNGVAAILDWLRARGEKASDCRPRRLDEPGAERLVVECEFADGGSSLPERSLVAKCYGDDSGESTCAVIQRLTFALTESVADTVLALPAALAYDARRRCLVQQRAPGRSLRDVMGDADAPVWFARTGRALADLHRLPLPAVAPKYLRNHFADLMRPHPVQLAEALPEYGTRILALVAEMEGLEWYWLEEIAPAPAHRDFHMRQAFCEGNKVWVIDWDLFARADPMLDVGNFLMVLETRAAERAGALSAAFLEGYFARRPPGGRKRIPLYKAVNYLRRACKHYRLRRGDWKQDVAAMLTRAEECLAEV